MRTICQTRRVRAFTLIELLLVIAIIAILAAILLPALTKGKQRAQRIQCISNLGQIGTAFQMFAHDHQGKYPMQVPIAEGGSQEYVNAGLNINGLFYFSFRHLQTLGNDLTAAKVLTCPADLDRTPALNFTSIQNSNVSYFVGAFADYNLPNSVLAGDRNITNDAKATASLVRGPYGLRWTREMHFFKGNVLFSDTHVEELNNSHMAIPDATTANLALFLPTVLPTPVLSGPVTFDPTQPPPGSTPTTSPPGDPGQSPSNPSNPGNPSQSPPGSSQPSVPGQTPTSSPTTAQGNPTASGSSPGYQSGYNSPNSPAPMNSPRPQTAPSSGGNYNAVTKSYHPSTSTITDPDAKEQKKTVAVSDPPTAAPTFADEGQPPLVWLLGAAKSAVGGTSWWLLFLLALLIAATAYVFSRRKKRVRQDYEE